MTIIHGVRSTNEVTPLLVDSLGRVIISTSEPTALNPTGSIVFYSNSALAAGNSDLVVYTVPANQRLRLTQISVTYVGTVAGVTLTPYCYDGVNLINLASVNPVVSAKDYPFVTDVLLEAGNTVHLFVAGATLNDDGYMEMAFQRYK